MKFDVFIDFEDKGGMMGFELLPIEDGDISQQTSCSDIDNKSIVEDIASTPFWEAQVHATKL